MRVKCWLCPSFAARTLKAVIRHIGVVHARDPNFHVNCGIEGCIRTYKNFASFKKHVYRHHREQIDPAQLDTRTEDGSTQQPPEMLHEDDGPDFLNRDAGYDHSEQAALFVLKAKHVHKISQSALDDLLFDVSTMISDRVHYVENKVCQHLQGPCNSSSSSGILEAFHHPAIVDSFHGLTSRYLQLNYYRENFGLLEPLEERLGRSVHTRRRDSTTRLTLEFDKAYYVSLLESLHLLLSQAAIFREVANGHQRHDGNMGDYCDSPAFKSHPLFSTDPSALQIMMYYDDVEVTNPLGSKTKTHKIAAFYYSIGNISPQYRSRLWNIQLLAITTSPTLQKYGPDRILEPIMKDIKILEQKGVDVIVDGIQHKFKGTVMLVPGDNLASQCLGGYKSLASALRKCRHCMAVNEDMQTKFSAKEFAPRNRSTHSHQCSALSGPLHDHNSTAFGLTRDSILNSSQYFHVTEGLVPDAMHDVLEGSLPFEIKELLKHLIADRIITLSSLNEIIRMFPYVGSDASNKPSPISQPTLSSADHHLRQNASQTWCLSRLLPLMIGDKVDSEDAYWQNYLLHLQINDYIFAPVISDDMVAHLEGLIADHHKTFKELYMCSIIPKMHYMVHYPEWMSRYGPLVRFWCMRFESKHNYFKDLAHRVKNFKNIPKTMAERHQEALCYHLRSGSQLGKNTHVGPVTISSVNQLDYKAILLGEGMSEEDKVTRPAWLEINGTKYSRNGVVVLGVAELPTFGIISDLVSSGAKYYLVCEVMFTICFNHHFHAYEVCKIDEPEYVVCEQKELSDHYVLSKYTVSGKYFVPLKYHLIDSS